jgi:hypothetical protein
MALSAQRRDRYRRIAARARRVPGEHGLRPYSVAIVVGTWSGRYIGGGAKYEQLEHIREANGQPPKVRFLSEEALALAASAGEGLQKGSCTIGPITPPFAGGGTALSDLVPAVHERQTVHVQLTGPAYPDGAKFVVKEVKTDRALHWMLTCEPVEGAT